MPVVCELCSAQVPDTQCPACGIDLRSPGYRLGQFAPAIAIGFVSYAIVRLGVRFFPDPDIEGVGLVVSGAVGALSAIYAIESSGFGKKLGAWALVAMAITGGFVVERLAWRGSLPNDLVGVLAPLAAGVVLGAIPGWPLSSLAGRFPPFSKINNLTGRIGNRRARLLARVVVHAAVVSAIVALVVAVVFVAIAIAVVYVAAVVVWGMLKHGLGIQTTSEPQTDGESQGEYNRRRELAREQEREQELAEEAARAEALAREQELAAQASRKARFECRICGEVQDPLLHTVGSSCSGTVSWRGSALYCDRCGVSIRYFECDECGRHSRFECVS